MDLLVKFLSSDITDNMYGRMNFMELIYAYDRF